MKKTCHICDYYRCVIRCDELPQRNKKVSFKLMQNNTVCVNPESSCFGERRTKRNLVCSNFRDWFFFGDFGGDAQTVRATQVVLVDKFRTEQLGLPAREHSGIAPV
ncbi:MAG: hypothetical protein FWB93_06105 [Oscillospiraceae bacterium]|nr:hypothetical protein [Oscillospiraceae bacterium]